MYQVHNGVLGSSPLARGLRPPGACGVVGRGIIPARAGFTLILTVLSGGAGDHPRSRGVYDRSRDHDSSFPGSSPLARGLRPAPPDGAPPPEDHPRSRGVYAQPCDGLLPGRGSSPLARGLPCGPAARRRGPADHPRSRGVYADQYPEADGEDGSSPLARGLLARVDRLRTGRGIIPARAGFTTSSTMTSAPTRDHPRSRGVYETRDSGHFRTPGSSPLARGLHLAILGIPTMPDPTRRLLPSLLT